MNGVKWGCRLVALLITVMLLRHWGSIFGPLKILYYLRSFDGFALLLVAMGMLFLLVNALAAVGMYQGKRWGFFATYVAIVFSTIFYAASYLPYFNKLFPAHYASLSLLMANVGVLLWVIYLQVMSHTKTPRSKKILHKKPRRKVQPKK
tara:strand:- start:195 stop:641 length:447 start_codon:yes stop_codon:yes gene_type:complete